MTLKINSTAPNFTSPSTSHKNYSLKDSLGKYVVLYFYPRDNTPGCTTETIDFNKLLKYFKKFVSACEFEHYPFEKPFHDIYKKELCISPMPALAVHFTNINSIYGLSPLIDYEKLWKENKI